jgi:hypothetical protein
MKESLKRLSYQAWKEGVRSGKISTEVEDVSILHRHPMERESLDFSLDPRKAEESPMWSDERSKKFATCEMFWQDDLDQLITFTIEQYGVFWPKPFWEKANNSIRPLVKNHPLGVDVFDPINKWIGAEWKGKRKRLSSSTIWSEISWTFQLFACDRAKNVEGAISVYNKRLKEQSAYHQCKICGWIFRPCDLPDYLYLRGEGSTDFCHTCLMRMFSLDRQGHQVKRFTKRKSDMSNALSTLVTLMGFVPSQDFRSIDTIRRVQRNRRLNVILHIWKMQSAQEYKLKFGSWLEALISARVLSNDCYPTGKGTRCLAKDKHECRSLEERQIDDWLYDEGIPHSTEPFYPYHPDLNPNNRNKADWMVNEIFIEYWGLVGNKEYDRRMRIKRRLAKDNNIQLIEILPDDLYDLTRKLGELKKSPQK